MFRVKRSPDRGLYRGKSGVRHSNNSIERHRMKVKYKLLASAISAAALAACGGGGDDASSPSPASPATPSTVIKGTAAVGAALPNATVQAKCAVGGGTATTATDGTFTLSIEGATRPCVLSVATPDGQTLHSVVESGSGTSAVANITPLTELVTAAIAGGSTADFFNNFDAAAQGKLTTEGVSAGTANLKLVLSGTLDLTGIDPIKDTLVAANGSTAGNGLDQKLDQLGEILTTAKTSISDLSAAVAANSNTGTTAVAPIQTILQPASSTCASFRSGKYHRVLLTKNAWENADVDATSLKITYPIDGGVDQLVADASEACRFAFSDGSTGTTDFVFSKSGVALSRDNAPDIGTNVGGLLIPKQDIPLSDLAGDWNGLLYGTGDGITWTPGRVTATLDSNGKYTAGHDCAGISTDCTPWPNLSSLTVNADGGFDTTTRKGPGRVFAFKGVDGQTALVMVRDGLFMIMSKAVTRKLPEVGFTNSYWDPTFGPNGQFASFITHTTRVTAVDTTARSYTREREDGRVDAFTLDKPSLGLRYRAPGAAAETIAISVAGTGFAAAIGVTNNFFSLSVDRP